MYLPGLEVVVLVVEEGVFSVVSVNFSLHKSVLHLQMCVLTPSLSISVQPIAPGDVSLSTHFLCHNSPF